MTQPQAPTLAPSEPVLFPPLTVGRLTDLDLGPVKVRVARRWDSGEFSRTGELTMFDGRETRIVGTVVFPGDDSPVINEVSLSDGTPYRFLAPLIHALSVYNVRIEGVVVL